MLQLPLFPDSLPRPRLPKAVVAQAGTVRTMMRRRRDMRYVRWMQYVSAFETQSVVPQMTGVKIGRTSTRRNPPPLTEQDVRDIRASKLSTADLAVKYRRSWTAIHDARRGNTFANVT